MEEICRYFGKKGLIETIKTMSLRYSKVKRLNDPFDCFPPLMLEENFNATQNNSNITPQKKIYNYYGLQEHILSFTTLPKMILMWGHYTDKYQGGVIVFNNTLQHFKLLRKIEYKEDSYVLTNDMFNIISDNTEHKVKNRKAAIKAFGNLFSTKQKTWSYEKEYRLLACKSKDGIYPEDLKTVGNYLYLDINPCDIKAICVGYRMSERNLANFVELCKSKSINTNCIYRVTPSKISYELDMTPYSVFIKSAHKDFPNKRKGGIYGNNKTAK